MANSIFSQVDYSEGSDLKERLRAQLFGAQSKKSNVVSFGSAGGRRFELLDDELAGVNAAMGIRDLQKDDNRPE